MQKVGIENLNDQGITLAAVIHFPQRFDQGKKYPAIVVSHPGGGVKEQTAGLYARSLAEHGFVAIAYDAYSKAEAFLTQPILAVVGSAAGSKWMGDDLLARAASRDKTLYIVDGANHMSLYDVPKYVGQAVPQLAPFFQRTLK